mgnify:CR=1 FL=1
MGNLTRIERSLKNIESHLEKIANKDKTTNHIRIFNTVSNAFHSVDGVLLVEGEKTFGGFRFMVYWDAETDEQEISKHFEEREKAIRDAHPHGNIDIQYNSVTVSEL